MSKQGKILRLREWRMGEKMQGGRSRHERYIDVVQVGNDHYICRHRHRATHRTHPLGKQGRHYWRLMQVPQIIQFDESMWASVACTEQWVGDRFVPATGLPKGCNDDAERVVEIPKDLRDELLRQLPPEKFQRLMYGNIDFKPVSERNDQPLLEAIDRLNVRQMATIPELYGGVHALPLVIDPTKPIRLTVDLDD